MTAEHLAILRDNATQELEESGIIADVISYEETETELGGREITESVAASYPVKLEETGTPSEKAGGGNRPVVVNMWTATLPWNAEIGHTQKLRISGEYYDVIETNEPATERTTLAASVAKAS